MAFVCPTCGEEHDDLPSIGSDAPFHWSKEFAGHPQNLLTKDLCIIEDRDFFVRGVIEIPVHDYEHEFSWGVWVSHKRENFEIYRAHSDSAKIGPFFGWLCTEINYYPQSTLDLQTMAHYRGGSLRPKIEIGEVDHPLYRHQRDGISLSEAWDMVHYYDSKC